MPAQMARPSDSQPWDAALDKPISAAGHQRPAGSWRWALAGVGLIVAAGVLSHLVPVRPQEADRRPAVQAGPALAECQVLASQPASQSADASQFVTRDADGHLQWPRPRSSERERERQRMVDVQIARGGPFHDAVQDERVLAAMRAVARHQFVGADRQGEAYDDTPLPIGHGQTISQPYIVALMTELLEVKEGDRVLEIGTGSGYQAAVLNELTPYVYTIEIIEPLFRQATERFQKLGYRTIQTRLGDGYDGWPEHAPFDGIIVTCAAGHVPPPLWDQLKPGGRMVIPIGGVYETQRLVVLTKQKDGTRRSRNVLPVRFVPMTGKIER